VERLRISFVGPRQAPRAPFASPRLEAVAAGDAVAAAHHLVVELPGFADGAVAVAEVAEVESGGKWRGVDARHAVHDVSSAFLRQLGDTESVHSGPRTSQTLHRLRGRPRFTPAAFRPQRPSFVAWEVCRYGARP